jgi:Holliday junction DNA helicase RuvA
MIDYIKGKISIKGLTSVIVEIGGVGIKVNVPIFTSEAIGEIGDEVRLLTVVSIKNEELNLYGFATKEEKELFSRLVSVQGIGSKTALGILSEIRVEDFERAIVDEDLATLTSVHGIGPKTAKRITFELKEEIKFAHPMVESSTIKSDAVNALVSLGFKKPKARDLVEKSLKEKKIETVEELLKESLKRI